MSIEGVTVVVTGVGGPAGRAASSYLHARGARVIGADMRQLDENPTAKILPAAAAPDFLPALLALIDTERAALLIPTVSEELPVVAAQRDVIRTRCSVMIGPPGAVRVADDKWETARVLSAGGVPSPRSYAGDSRSVLLAALTLPMIEKPRVGRGGRGVRVIRTLGDLPDRILPDLVYQEFLPGEEYDVNLFAAPGGEPVATVVLRKTALKSGEVGNAAGVERVRADDVARVAEEAVRALGLEGPLDVDVRRGADGRPAVLEINARVGANVRSADEVLDAMMRFWESRT